MPSINPRPGDAVRVALDIPIQNGGDESYDATVTMIGVIQDLPPTMPNQARVNVRGNPYVLTMTIPIARLVWDSGIDSWTVYPPT